MRCIIGLVVIGEVLAATLVCQLQPACAQTPPDGTVVYCRHNSTNDLTTVWFANLQTHTDSLITTGWMAHVSLDRRYLVCLRNGPNGSAYGSRGDLWVLDLISGGETNLFHNNDYVVSADFSRDNSLVFLDYECSDYSVPRDGSANGNLTFLSGSNCYDDAPAVNPVDGRIVYHNNASGGGIGIADTNFQNKALVPNTALGTYALWSHDGQWISFTLTSNYYTYAGYNLYKVHPDGTGLTQLTFLTGPTNAFPQGAAWAAGGNNLIGAATINGVNGLYRVSSDGSGTISLLNFIQPGDPVVYVGDVLGSSSSPGPQLSAQLTSTNTVLVYWASSLAGFNLQQNVDFGASQWSTPPEAISDNGTIKFIVVPNPTSNRFFRLSKP